MHSLFVSLPLSLMLGYFAGTYLPWPDWAIVSTLGGFVLGFICSYLLDR